MLGGKTGAGPHLAFVPGGQRDRDAGRDHRVAPGAIVTGASAGTAAKRSSPAAARSGRRAAADRRHAAARDHLNCDVIHARLCPAPPAMRATSACATSSLDCDGQDSTPCRRDEMHRVAVAAHDAGLRPTRRWRRSSRSPCASAWPWRARSRSRSRPQSRSRAAAASALQLARRVARMSGFSTSASRGGAACRPS